MEAVDALLFEDGNTPFALGGFRERRRVTDLPDVEEVTAVFCRPIEADVRAAVVDLGRGTLEDFERLDALGIELTGAVGIVELAVTETWLSHGDWNFIDPGKLPTPPAITETARWAASRGVRALLVAPPENAGPFAVVEDLPERIESALGADSRTGPLDPEGPLLQPELPCLRVRRSHLELIRDRLRAKRVRGADGKTETVRVGPGPIEAHVVIRRAPAGE
ncbi:MAG: hypothetical protein AAFP86_13825 [Planctomycetota bacterium]